MYAIMDDVKQKRDEDAAVGSAKAGLFMQG